MVAAVRFQQLITQAADDGIGTPLLGLGLGLSPAVMKAMSEGDEIPTENLLGQRQ